MKENHSRFKDAPWYPKEEINVIIGGAGGIGSWTALAIARAGFIPIVYDYDVIEAHNMGGQLYHKRSVGQLKVDALAGIIIDFADTTITPFIEKVSKETMTHKYVITAFDNIQARSDMFYSWHDQYKDDPTALFIDGRLNAEHMQIFCVRGNSPAAASLYTTHLVPDSDIEEALCTLKQTSHAAMMIASHITGFFTNHITNVFDEDNTREVPFLWEYFIPIDYLNVQK